MINCYIIFVLLFIKKKNIVVFNLGLNIFKDKLIIYLA